MSDKTQVLCYIAMGSNLNDPLRQLFCAVESIASLGNTNILSVSDIYKSLPLGPKNQPVYYNGVLAIKTDSNPDQLLDRLQSIENAQGRVRKERWGARTLDLDILLYGDEIITKNHLKIPHPQMHLRNFVIVPLCDIAPELILPSGQKIVDIKAQLGTKGLDNLHIRPVS